MINFFLFHKVFSLIIILASIYLGLLVYLSNRKEKINKFFLILSISIACWIGFYYLTVSQASLLWSKLAYATVSIVYLFFYLFFVYFLGFEKKLKILSILVIISSLILFFISLFTDWIVKNIILINGNVDLLLGPWNIGFYAMAIFLSFFIILLLIIKYFQLSYNEKVKIQYFLIGVFCWLFMNFIFNMLLPLWKGSVRYAEFGNYSTIFLLGFTAYAIVKKKLFETKVVLTGLFVALIALLLFLDLLILTDNPWVQIAKGVILLIFIGFGYFLIKSVLLEIKRREELENLTSQLETTNIKLRAAYKKLERLDKAKSEFISIASHQLRTPLTIVKGYISMILEESYGKTIKGMKKPLQSIYESNERLIKLVNDLLNVSRIEAGKLKLELEKVSIEDIILGILEELNIVAQKKNISLKFEKPDKSLPLFLLDKEKIRQVIMNIIDNAIRYTKRGEIIINCFIEKDLYKIEINDTGEGMSQNEISKLFETFSRGVAGNRHWGEGAGLGLYIARKFVEMHSGRIWAESEGKGKGSTFYIELPLLEKEPE